MDLQSLWLKNCSLLDVMNDSEYKCKEDELITSCFGGTRNMIKLILKHQDNLSYIQQKHLHQILKKAPPITDTKHITNNAQHTISNVSNTEHNKPITLSHLNEDCVSYIFQFLNQNQRNCFSVTSRNICIASKSRKSHANYDILAIEQKQSLKVYHFINQISEMKNINDVYDDHNTSQFVQEIESFIAWTNNQKLSQCNITDIICKSGLLMTFSNLITNTYFITHHIKLIQSIIFLFKTLSEYTHLSLYLINANLIENLKCLIHIIMNTESRNDLSTQNQIISGVVYSICNLYFVKNMMQSSVWNRIFKSDIILDFISILKRPYSLNHNKDILWITSAIALISEFINYDPLELYYSGADVDVMDIIYKYMHKISALIDVKSDKKWIYQLLCKGHTVSIRDPNTIYSYDSTFTISEIVDLSNAQITLIGKFDEDYYSPVRKLCVELSHIYCTSQSDSFGKRSVYPAIMAAFGAICRLLSVYDACCQSIDFKELKYKPITDAITHIIQVSQTQFPQNCRSNINSRSSILLILLTMDWEFFMDLIGEEVATEFTSLGVSLMGIGHLYPLMSVAWNRNSLDALCEMQWFRDEIYQHATFGFHPVPLNWDQCLLLSLLVNFHNNYESYNFLYELLSYFDVEDIYNSRIDPDFFVSQNGIHYLLVIIANTWEYVPESNRIRMDIIRKCKQLVANLFVYWPRTTYLREEILKLDTLMASSMMLKLCWWVILKDILIDTDNEHHIKCVLEEMTWYFKCVSADVDTFVTESARDLLLGLQNRKFQDDGIAILLQSILSLL